MMADPTLAQDPDVKMPAAVRASIEKSKAYFDAANRGELVTNPDTMDSDKDDLEPLRMTVTPQGNEGEQLSDAQPVPDSSVTSTEQPKSASEIPETGEDGSWEHRYNAMHGRFKKAAEDNRELAQRVEQMQQLLATMQAAPSAPAETASLDLDLGDTDISADELNDYGEDLLKVVGKKAKAEIIPVLKKALERIAELEGRVNNVAQASQNTAQTNARERLHSFMDERLPQWRQLNSSDEFIQWLALRDPLSGGIRHDMLRAAYTAGDAPRVKAFFDGFLAEEAAVAPAATRATTGAETTPKVPLEELAAPGRAKSAAAEPAPAEKPVITRAQIAAFYADVAAGRYRGRDADRAQMEKAIFSAQADGRIR